MIENALRASSNPEFELWGGSESGITAPEWRRFLLYLASPKLLDRSPKLAKLA